MQVGLCNISEVGIVTSCPPPLSRKDRQPPPPCSARQALILFVLRLQKFQFWFLSVKGETTALADDCDHVRDVSRLGSKFS